MLTTSSSQQQQQQQQPTGLPITTRTYGVSAPLSVETPTQRDKDLTQKLEETLQPYNVFETFSELGHRMDVLHKINTLFKDWIKTISMSKV
jgi:poly(A) polymerase